MISSTTFVSWAILIALIGTIVNFAIWARGPNRPRVLALISFIVAVPLTAFLLGTSLGKPLPFIQYLTAPKGTFKVIGFKPVENEAIYVLIEREEGPPQFIALPWDWKQAEALEKAADEGDEGVMTELSSFDEPRFWPQPPLPKGPAKVPQDEPVLRFDGGS